ncbi:hypothetical protein [Streptomyces sp. NPDC050528]|uniref:hypothetical protein n=1 Tax=Streptomyces sp. NPDC050528 TaxID=3365623 RepID=UPI0037A2A880
MGRGLAIATARARSGVALDVTVVLGRNMSGVDPPAPPALPPRGTPLGLAVPSVLLMPGVGRVRSFARGGARVRVRVNRARVGLS